MIISFAGLHGTGKSTIAKKIAEYLKYTYYSTGMAFRELAKLKNMTLEEFSHYAEDHLEIDRLLDDKIKLMAEMGNSYVFDGQLPAFMLGDLNDYRILLTCDDDVRLARMASRDNRSLKDQHKETIAREESERDRFIQLYNLDILDPSTILKNFDLIINTTELNIEEVSKLCRVAIEGISRSIKEKET
ncbi:MAG: (d)CMP kinase [Promethearchaeota archaeon]